MNEIERRRPTLSPVELGKATAPDAARRILRLSNRMVHDDNALLIACTEIGVPLTLLSAALMRWAAKPLQATLKAVRLEDEAISRSP